VVPAIIAAVVMIIFAVSFNDKTQNKIETNELVEENNA